jgi:SAM-dependent methyltransferase
MSAPNNLVDVDCSPDALERDARYGVQILDGYAAWVSNAPVSTEGKRVLELGPGINYAGALGLIARGAIKASVADRWLSPWRENYHPLVYSRISEILSAQGRSAEASVFAKAAREGHAGFIDEIASAAERLDAPDGAFDIVFSNAVLEHMEDHERASAELFRVTARDGWNFHQVDYRDHRDFSRPLEHLLLTRDEFLVKADAAHFEMGCQERLTDHRMLFETAGFEVFGVYPNLEADQSYVMDLESRGFRVGDATLGALIILHKP